MAWVVRAWVDRAWAEVAAPECVDRAVREWVGLSSFAAPVVRVTETTLDPVAVVARADLVVARRVVRKAGAASVGR